MATRNLRGEVEDLLRQGFQGTSTEIAKELGAQIGVILGLLKALVGEGVIQLTLVPTGTRGRKRHLYHRRIG